MAIDCWPRTSGPLEIGSRTVVLVGLWFASAVFTFDEAAQGLIAEAGLSLMVDSFMEFRYNSFIEA